MEDKIYERIYLEYYPKVFSYLSSRLDRVEDAENLAQSVFMKVYIKADLFDPKKSSISTWIFNITRNTLIDYQRSMSYRRHEDLAKAPEETDENILESIIAEETLAELASSLQELSEDERHVIILHYYENFTLLNISEIMHRPYGQIKRLHAKALSHLKTALIK